MAYASQTDLTNLGVPVAALGTGSTAVTTQQINAELDAASTFADGFFRARWGMTSVPLLTFDSTITRMVAKIAAYWIMCVRGYFSGGDTNEEFRRGYDDAVDWLNKVQRQQIHPSGSTAQGALLTGSPGPQQPNFVSASVINLSNGATGQKRGW